MNESTDEVVNTFLLSSFKIRIPVSLLSPFRLKKTFLRECYLIFSFKLYKVEIKIHFRLSC